MADFTLGEGGEDRGDFGEREAVPVTADGVSNVLQTTPQSTGLNRHWHSRRVVRIRNAVGQVGNTRATDEHASRRPRPQALEGGGIFQHNILCPLEYGKDAVVAKKAGTRRVRGFEAQYAPEDVTELREGKDITVEHEAI